MRKPVELQTGQVASISGLMAGYSLSIAAHALRYGIRSRMAQMVFLLFLLSSLRFLVSMYTDVRLSMELVGVWSSMIVAVTLGTLWLIPQSINVISFDLENLQ